MPLKQVPREKIPWYPSIDAIQEIIRKLRDG